MFITFPVTPADYALVLSAIAFTSVLMSALLPARWGWKAFPLVALGLLLTAVVALGLTFLIEQAAAGKDQGFGIVLRAPSFLLFAAAIAATAAFGGTQIVRHRRLQL